MFFIYVDESGDVGTNNSPTPFFCLSGLVVHELRWHDTLEAIINFRRSLRTRYGLKLRDEIHAAVLLSKPGDLRRIPKSLRLRLLRDTLDFQANLSDISIVNVVVDKAANQGRDIFEIAWTTLIQRFHNTLSYRNFPGPQNSDDRGMLIVDKTDEVKLRALSRRMRVYNPVPSMFGGGSTTIPTRTIVEDAVHRDSLHSYLIQLSDVNAYFLYQKYKPNKYIKAKGGANYFNRLDDVLCKVASRSHPQGVVVR